LKGRGGRGGITRNNKYTRVSWNIRIGREKWWKRS
jgi:hypothetical protein